MTMAAQIMTYQNIRTQKSCWDEIEMFICLKTGIQGKIQ